MSNKNHFSKTFDDGTKAKLEIFRNYFNEWLPVFISSEKNNYWKNIFIYDFFSGEGMDCDKNYGSPLIILDALNRSDNVPKTSVKINVNLNEMNKKRYNILEKNVSNFKYDKEKIKVRIFNKSFKDLFLELYPKMIKDKELPRLMFLDQFGIKEITEDIFKKLVSFKRTDFIFFISSSFINRFGGQNEFQNYIKITKKEFEKSKPFHCHKVVFEYYKSLIDTDYMLAPFSIKKGKNIYGLIFGSNHSYGIEKFLKVAWKINPNTGDANFNIDEEKIIDGQFSMFEEDNTIKKLGLLEKEIKKEIFVNKEKSLHKIYLKTLEFGCRPKHCNEILRKLVKDNKIEPVKTVSDGIHKLVKKPIEIKTK